MSCRGVHKVIGGAAYMWCGTVVVGAKLTTYYCCCTFVARSRSADPTARPDKIRPLRVYPHLVTSASNLLVSQHTMCLSRRVSRAVDCCGSCDHRIPRAYPLVPVPDSHIIHSSFSVSKLLHPRRTSFSKSSAAINSR